jgi:hypothetical protein
MLTREASVQVTVFGLMQLYSSGPHNLCTKLGGDCPDKGKYPLSGMPFSLPRNGDAWYAMHGPAGVSIMVTATFNFDGEVTTCEGKILLNSEEKKSSSKGSSKSSSRKMLR